MIDCSVAQCLEVVGEWWSLLIVRDAFLGVTRFDDFQRRLGISRNMLRQRLTRLVDAGVLEKVPYSEHPPRYDYRLTDKGRDLWPVMTAMRQWGDRHAAPNGPPVALVHKGVRRDHRRRLRLRELRRTGRRATFGRPGLVGRRELLGAAADAPGARAANRPRSVQLGDRDRLDDDALGGRARRRADRVDRLDDVEARDDLAEQ